MLGLYIILCLLLTLDFQGIILDQQVRYILCVSPQVDAKDPAPQIPFLPAELKTTYRSLLGTSPEPSSYYQKVFVHRAKGVFERVLMTPKVHVRSVSS